MVLGAMSGFDPRDSTSVDTPVPNYVAGLDAPGHHFAFRDAFAQVGHLDDVNTHPVMPPSLV